MIGLALPIKPGGFDIQGQGNSSFWARVKGFGGLLGSKLWQPKTKAGEDKILSSFWGCLHFLDHFYFCGCLHVLRSSSFCSPPSNLLVKSSKPFNKLTGTGEQTGGQAGRQTGGKAGGQAGQQDHLLSQTDAMTKNRNKK